MVGDNKILTVSYGTFSCTLEGFDDPFAMMKAIAEYFRDLTERDRFFGAEPPQPDTEMLHKIAQQTGNTSVDVEVSDSTMVLRNANGDGGFQPVTAPPAATAVAAALASSPAEGAAQSLVPAPAPLPADIDGDSIAAKLQRIRAVVSREVVRSERIEASFSEDQHAEGFEDTDAAPEETSFVADDSYDDEDMPAANSAQEFVDSDADVTEDKMAVEETADAEDELTAAAEDPVSDEAVADDSAEEFEADEAEAAQADTADSMEDDDAAVADASETDQAEADVTADAAQEDVAAAETADEVEAADDDMVETADVAEESADNTAAETDEADLEAAADADRVAESEGEKAEVKPRRRIIVQKISRADVEAAQPGATADAASDDASNADLSPEAEAALMKELEAVEAEMETAETSGVVTEALGFTERRKSEPAIVTVTAKNSVKITSKLRPGETEEERAARLERRAMMVEDEDAALNRLMDATSSRLSDDDEGAVRRASIAHLKAAVAATKADDSIAQAAADEEERELDQYRSDLAQVVIPSKSKPLSRDGAKSGAKDGEGARSRPLMLVSEQRIDDPADEPAAAAARDVRSRPITAGNLALQEQVDVDEVADAIADRGSEDFSSFAARLGALELPDLLEAAAAHFTYVEGTGSFTRPMLMRKISTISDAENISREAGLRSFGALLREGKLVKGDDGKFVISGNSRFAPEAREDGA